MRVYPRDRLLSGKRCPICGKPRYDWDKQRAANKKALYCSPECSESARQIRGDVNPGVKSSKNLEKILSKRRPKLLKNGDSLKSFLEALKK